MKAAPLLPRALLIAVFILGALPHFWLAVHDHGMYWPDEIWQSLEQAHRYAFGPGKVPWEFVEGARSWLLPGLIGIYWKTLSALGMQDGLTLVIAAKLLVTAATVAAIGLGMLLAHRHGGPLAALLAGAVGALHPAVLLLGHRALSEVVCAPMLIGALLLVGRPGPRAAAAAGLLAGLAVFVRYPAGLALPVLLAMLLHARRWDDAKYFTLGACAAGAIGGAIDAFTWGAPFAAFLNYMDFNLAASADYFGSAGPLFYAQTSFSVAGPAQAVLLAGFLLGARRMPGAFALVVLYALVHSAIPHKEMRFLYAVLPIATAVSAIGLAWLIEKAPRPKLVATGAALVLGFSLASSAATTRFADWGLYSGTPAAEDSPWHANEGAYRLVAYAGTRPDLCGIWVMGLRGAWTGGYTYLHRSANWPWGNDPVNALVANYLVHSEKPPAYPVGWDQPAPVPDGYVGIARSGEWTLYRREGGCATAVEP